MNKLIKLILIIFLLNSTVGNSQEQSIDSENKDQGFIIESQKYQISMYALAAKPNVFDGKKVFITGYARFHFGFYIYPDKNSCIDYFNINSIYINISEDLYKKHDNKHNNCGIVRVSGEFEKYNEYGKDINQDLVIGVINNLEGIYDY